VGLYNGSLDGVIGPQTKQALLGFQDSNGLKRTATLDQQTADALIGNTGVEGEGSSTPPKGAGTGSANNFGNHPGQ
jgi:peptidoglycan hydrolase-like protein with peptidoglycan-binding domain